MFRCSVVLFFYQFREYYLGHNRRNICLEYYAMSSSNSSAVLDLVFSNTRPPSETLSLSLSPFPEAFLPFTPTKRKKLRKFVIRLREGVKNSVVWQVLSRTYVTPITWLNVNKLFSWDAQEVCLIVAQVKRKIRRMILHFVIIKIILNSS